jgi:hypothetical protein
MPSHVARYPLNAFNVAATPSHTSPSYAKVLWRSRIGINFCPLFPNLLILLLRLLSIRFGPFQSLRSQALVDLRLCAIAHAYGFPQEPSGMAFVEHSHDFFAHCDKLAFLSAVRQGNDVPLLSFVCKWGCILPLEPSSCYDFARLV